MQKKALIEFFRMVPQARMPVRADKSAFGSIPVAAYKYCQPLTTATGYGWYVYVPISFALMWDGSDTLWSYEGSEAWQPLSTAQFPGFREEFELRAPDSVRSYPPLFLADSVRRGIIQIWTGLFARTTDDWSLKLRPLVNYPSPKTHEVFEAIVETDEWFGPLFVNVRLIQRNRPIVFTVDRPLFQIQLVHRSCYSQSVYDTSVFHEDDSDFGEQEWRDYEKTIVLPNKKVDRERGEYARHSRKRGKSELAHGEAQNRSDISD
jgi:Family of unknown function (DUF6065)